MCVICTDIYIIMVCNCHEKVRPKWASYFVRDIALNHWFVLLYSCISLLLCPWISLLWALAVASAAMLRRLLPLSRLIWLSIHILVYCIWILDLFALGIGSCLSSNAEEVAASFQINLIINPHSGILYLDFTLCMALHRMLDLFCCTLISHCPCALGSHCSRHWQLPQQCHWGGCCHSPVHKHCMINWFCCTLMSHCPCALWISLLWALAVASAALLRRLLSLSRSDQSNYQSTFWILCLHYTWCCIGWPICFVVFLDLFALGIGSCLCSTAEEAVATVQIDLIINPHPDFECALCMRLQWKLICCFDDLHVSPWWDSNMGQLHFIMLGKIPV